MANKKGLFEDLFGDLQLEHEEDQKKAGLQEKKVSESVEKTKPKEKKKSAPVKKKEPEKKASKPAPAVKEATPVVEDIPVEETTPPVRKVGRPKNENPVPTSCQSIYIRDEIKPLLKVAALKNGGSVSAYVNSLIAKDIEENRDLYTELAKILDIEIE